jgi:hypothetical protein
MNGNQPAKDHLYMVGTSPSLRWAGVKGKVAFVEVATYDEPTITIQGEKRGRIEFPVSDIRSIRATVEYGKWTLWRCIIAREGGADVVLDGTASDDYPDLVLHIAEEMEAMGRFDRVERGARWWESLIHLVIFGGICLVLLYAPYDTWRLYGADWTRNAYLIWGGFTLFPLAGLAYVVGTWWRWYRPRRVRGWDDLEEMLI